MNRPLAEELQELLPSGIAAISARPLAEERVAPMGEPASDGSRMYAASP